MATAHLFLDQIEEELAVLTEPGGEGEQDKEGEQNEEAQEYMVPLTDLPVGVQEGDWLTVEIPTEDTLSYYNAVQEGRERWPEFVVNEAMGEAAKHQVQALMDELSG